MKTIKQDILWGILQNLNKFTAKLSHANQEKNVLFTELQSLMFVHYLADILE